MPVSEPPLPDTAPTVLAISAEQMATAGSPVVDAAASPAALAALAAAMDFASEALAPATLRAYRADWHHFLAWCREAGWPALPAAPDTVAAYWPRWPSPTPAAPSHAAWPR